MLKNLFLVTVLFLSVTVFAQKSSMKFGKIDRDDLIMKNFESDTSAGGLVLGDIGQMKIDYKVGTGFELVYKRHVRVKVFNANGFDLANFKIPYYEIGTSRERISSIKVTSYNLENDKVVETSLKKSDMYVEDISSKEKSLNFSAPGIKAGTVFEVEYQLFSDFFWIMRDWDFQYTVPARFSELTVTLPEYFVYKRLMKGYVQPTISKTDSYTSNLSVRDNNNAVQNIPYQTYTQKIRFEDVPAFKQEPYMNAMSTYLASIEFELSAVNFPYSRKDYSSSWEKISKELWQDDDFGTQIKRKTAVKEYTDLLMAIPDEKQRMITAFDLVRSNMAFNNKYGIYITTTLPKAWDKKTGKAADINLLLISLLRDVGIEAEPVILSTRDNGQVHPAQVMLSRFNYVIAEARIGEEAFLLDATQKRLPYTMLPERCLNGNGRRISMKPELNDWVNLNQNITNERVMFTQVKVNPSGKIEGDFDLMETNYFAFNRSKKIRDKASHEEYISDFEGELPGLLIDDYTIVDPDNLQEPLHIKFKGRLNDSDEAPKDMIYFNPLMGSGITSNPFTLEEREFPVDFINPYTYKVINMIEIPEGYQVAEVPVSAAISLPDGMGMYRYNIVVNDNQIQVNSTFMMKSAVITSIHYKHLRDFYSRIVAKNAEMLVLKKI